MRSADITRKTTETEISLSLNIDGKGSYDIQTGVGFLDHMLELFARHGCFDLQLRCAGDLRVDAHHTTEDIGICLGRAFAQAAGERRGITRYGSALLPMDESLVLCAVDFGGRSYLRYDLQLAAQRVGDFDTELVEEFMRAFCANAGMNLHIKTISAGNTHHMVEAAFKGLARALRQALRVDAALSEEIPSTKGAL
ncbi:MAG: imidazoleglycerol-phosphate dehydratase HisB [Oscillospiraceae bacterium]|jgi:imidazoleglycerol-phosphate dehydratase|nr:imidazoleglycerol-phosphate dehydratase HisB [Oscillospiraceae bacterium]